MTSASPGFSAPTPAAKESNRSNSDDDLQIVQEIPGKSAGSSMSSMAAFGGLGGMFGAGGSSRSGFIPSSALNNLMAAQDPYYSNFFPGMSASGSASSSSMDLLQKCKCFVIFAGIIELHNHINF